MTLPETPATHLQHTISGTPMRHGSVAENGWLKIAYLLHLSCHLSLPASHINPNALLSEDIVMWVTCRSPFLDSLCSVCRGPLSAPWLLGENSGSDKSHCRFTPNIMIAVGKDVQVIVFLPSLNRLACELLLILHHQWLELTAGDICLCCPHYKAATREEKRELRPFTTCYCSVTTLVSGPGKCLSCLKCI